ncbi:unnamed protein product [Effrenium voratum]|nr:unnamed protein product [Effrenium voratum]
MPSRAKAPGWLESLQLLSERKSGLECSTYHYNLAITAVQRWTLALHLAARLGVVGLQADEVSQGAAARQLGERWESCCQVLASLTRGRVRANAVALNTLVTSSRGERWQQGLRTLLDLVVKGIETQELALNAGMSACERGGSWVRSVALLSRFGALQRDVISFSTCISACGKRDVWPASLGLLVSLSAQAVQGNTITLNALLSSLTGRWAMTMKLLAMCFTWSLQATIATYGAAISSQEKQRRWQHALTILDMVGACCLQANTIACNAAMSSCEKGGKWQFSLHILARLLSRRLRADACTYGAAISACEKGEKWERALALLQQSQDSLLQLNIVLFNAAISRWQDALVLVSQIRAGFLQPSLVTYSSAICATSRWELWELSLCLLRQLSEDGLEANVITCNAALSTCAHARAWQQAMALFGTMSSMHFDEVTFAAASRAAEVRGTLLPEVLRDLRRREPAQLAKGRTVSDTDHPIDVLLREKGNNTERYLVVVSSLSLDWKELVKIPGVSNYELRLLWHLFFLRSSKMHVVMCTSQYIPEALIKYYLSYLPGNVDLEEARSRLTTICCNDHSAGSVTQKLLTRRRTLERIKNAINPETAAMTCFNSTDAEVELAKELGVPLFGTDTQGAFWGTKTGNRQIFREAGIPHPDGSYDEIYDELSLAKEILALLRRNPTAQKVMVKLNDSFSGEGNAVLRVDKDLAAAAKGTDEVAVPAILEKLHSSLEYVAPGLTWARYYSQFQSLGGVCEAFIEGAADAKTSPSCQAFLSGAGVRILGTHEQMLNGQIYTGCKFPAFQEYSADLITETLKIGKEMIRHEVVGYISVDFVSVRQDDGSYKHWAIEINVRMGGTTLPIMTLNLLCESGALNDRTSEFIASDGKPRYYIASDTLRKPCYKGLVIEDLLDIIKRHSAEIEWNCRPEAPETGAIFHLVTLLSELGKCGLVCVGRTREEAEQIFGRVKEILDNEVEAEAEISLVVEGDSSDMLS